MSSVPVPAWYWEKLLSPRLKVNLGKGAFFDFTIVFSKLLPGEGGWSKSLVSSAGKSLLITKFFKKNPEFATGNFDVSRELFSDLPRAIFKFHGQLLAKFATGNFACFTGNFWNPNLPRAIFEFHGDFFAICRGQQKVLQPKKKNFHPRGTVFPLNLSKFLVSGLRKVSGRYKVNCLATNESVN